MDVLTTDLKKKNICYDYLYLATPPLTTGDRHLPLYDDENISRCRRWTDFQNKLILTDESVKK